MKKEKNLLSGMLGVSIGWLISKIYIDKKRLGEHKEKDKIIEKQKAALAVYEQWVEAFQKKQKISDYLLGNHYCNVAIYGLGRLGKQLYRELNSSKINVPYIIDLTYGKEHRFYGTTPCLHPDDRLPEADLIIVTIPNEAKEIVSHLERKAVCPIKLINDVLFVL